MLSFTKTSDSGSPQVEVSREKIISSLREILAKRFPGDMERQRIIPMLNGVRLNFCCPYCGDSHDNPRKKRGNFMSKILYFKCYNGGCEKYVDIIKMIKDFDVQDTLSDEDKTSAKLLIASSQEQARQDRINRHELSLDVLTNTNFKEVLVPRKDLMTALRLIEIHPRSAMGVYLTKRIQNPDKRFAWDSWKKRLFIFNLDSTQEWVFSLQTRQFDNENSKYLTYNLSGIWLKLMKRQDEEFLNKVRTLDLVSTVFNVLNINFNDPITLFEGPLDAFLYKNAVGMCSINNKWPFDVGYRWFQDNDDAGRKKALSEIGEGKSVFLWKKFIDEFELHGKKIKDYNDIVIYEKANNIDFGSLEKFWSTHQYDGIYL
jgi:hypothetical protein